MIDASYEQAMTSYRSGEWEKALRLSETTILEIDSREWKDWLYRGELMPRMTYFSGDYVYFTTSEGGEAYGQGDKVMIYDPAVDNLVRVFDFTPWHIVGSTHTPEYTITYTQKNDFLGYRIIWFEAGNPINERMIQRDGIEIFDVVRTTESNVLDFLEKGPMGWSLHILDLATGEMKEVHRFGTVDLTKSIWDHYRVIREKDYWRFVDGDKIYTLEVGSWKKDLYTVLPFDVSEFDNFCKECSRRYAAVRGDTLFFLAPHGSRDRTLKSVKLPFPLAINHNTKKIDVDRSGRWFAQSDVDSLRIFRITKGAARLAHSTPSSIGGTFELRTRTFWKGDTLVHYGNSGLKIFKGSKPIYSIEADDFFTGYDFELGLFFIYQAPGKFSVLDIEDLSILWDRKYSVSHLEVFDDIKKKYLMINHMDGTSLVDIRTGTEVLHAPDAATRGHEVNSDTTKILLRGENSLGVFEISNRQKLMADMIAVSAASNWSLGDTTAALRKTREALAASSRLSGDLPLDLLKILTSLDLDKEANRLLANMALKSDDMKWRNDLEEAGLELMIEPHLTDFFAFFTMQKGIFAFPVIIYPFNVARGSRIRNYWFDKSGTHVEKRLIPMSGITVSDNELFFFKYKINSDRSVVEWNPLLLKESGEMVDLGLLLETDVKSENPAKQFYSNYALNYLPYSAQTESRILTNFMLGNNAIGASTFSIGIDMTGSGNNWYDTTTVDPVRIGSKFYAQKHYADIITMIAEGSQADSIGIKVGDIVTSFAGYSISNTITVGRIKTYFPDRTPLDLTVLRDGRELSFIVLNGRIGYEYLECHSLIEIDPETGKHLNEISIPPGYRLRSHNKSGELVYACMDTMLFFDPETLNERRVTIKDLKNYVRLMDYEDKELLAMVQDPGHEFLVIDVSKNAKDADRILWRQTWENIYRLRGSIRIVFTDDYDTFPIVLDDGTLLIHDIETGAVLAREIIPFHNFGFIPQIVDGAIYGVAASNIFGWKIDYYHPPFPWKHMGFGALGIIPLFFVGLYLNHIREERLKRKHIEELKRAEITAEISAARNLQAGLIPTGSHELGDFHLVGKFIPASEVGGDYFDFRLLDDGRLVVAMGDVSGHGLPAGILVSMAKASLMTVHRSSGFDFSDTLDSLNEVISNGSPGKKMFMTLCYLVLDSEKRMIGCSANGHPFPIIAARDGSISEIGSAGGYPLGVREKQKFNIVEAEFKPGDTILMYTDGIPEQMNEKGEPWGYEEFYDAFHSLAGLESTEAIVDGMLDQVLQYAGNAVKQDDMALVAIRYRRSKI
jgi:serine phosphatase RsbU (regulator of sigma subunit)